MIDKLATLRWFMERPSFWRHAVELGLRKGRANKDTDTDVDAATQWGRAVAVPVAEALARVGLLASASAAVPALPAALLDEANALAAKAKVTMGGPGDLDLIYAATMLSKADRVVETGVAYGWSSLAVLAALAGRPNAALVSVDMPYPKAGNEAWVGVAVPQSLRGPWRLVREPDRNGLPKAIAMLGGTTDLCHFDSDKSYWGRQFAFPLMWQSLRPGGIFISDDIQDNLAFKEFVEAERAVFAVTEAHGKLVGIARKAAG